MLISRIYTCIRLCTQYNSKIQVYGNYLKEFAFLRELCMLSFAFLLSLSLFADLNIQMFRIHACLSARCVYCSVQNSLAESPLTTKARALHEWIKLKYQTSSLWSVFARSRVKTRRAEEVFLKYLPGFMNETGQPWRQRSKVVFCTIYYLQSMGSG